MLRPVFVNITQYFRELLSPVIEILHSKIDHVQDERQQKELIEQLQEEHEENLRLVQEMSDERICNLQHQKELKRQIDALNSQNLLLQRDAENLPAQMAMMQRSDDGGLFSSILGSSLGGYPGSFFRK